MGLDNLKKILSDNIIANETSKEDYYNLFEKSFAININVSKSNATYKPNKLEDLILLTLFRFFTEDKYFTTSQIAKLISKYFADNPKNKNNVSRYFNQYFHPYYDIKLIDSKKKYKLSQTGFSHAIYLTKKQK